MGKSPMKSKQILKRLGSKVRLITFFYLCLGTFVKSFISLVKIVPGLLHFHPAASQKRKGYSKRRTCLPFFVCRKINPFRRSSVYHKDPIVLPWYQASMPPRRDAPPGAHGTVPHLSGYHQELPKHDKALYEIRI